MSGYAHQWAKRQRVGDSSAKTLLKTYASWAAEDYTTWVTNEEMLLDTELNIETIRKARTRLIELGYLIETKKRLGETRSIVVYQMLAPEGSTVVQSMDQRSGETISLSPPTREQYDAKPLGKRSPSKSRATSKGVEKPSPSEIEAPRDSESSPSKSRVKPLEIPSQVARNPEPNISSSLSELGNSSSNACEEAHVDNSAAAAADLKNETPNTERELTDLLIDLERQRGKDLVIDRSRDRVHVLTWIGKGVTAKQLRTAHKLAVAARKRDTNDRPTYAGFVSTFIDEVLAPAATPAVQAAPDWWSAGEEVLIAAGQRFGARPKQRDEPLPLYRAVVARAAGKGPWIDAILRDAQRGGGQFQQMIVATIGEALLPVDWYAS